MKYKNCAICGGDILVYLKIFGREKRKKNLISNDGILIKKRWVCNHCFDIWFKPYFESFTDISRLLNEDKDLNSLELNKMEVKW